MLRMRLASLKTPVVFDRENDFESMILALLTAVPHYLNLQKKKLWVMYFDFWQNISFLDPNGLSKKKWYKNLYICLAGQIMDISGM